MAFLLNSNGLFHYLTILKCYLLLKYPIPMKKETQGLTDTYIGNWLKSRPRDQVLFPNFILSQSFLTLSFFN